MRSAVLREASASLEHRLSAFAHLRQAVGEADADIAAGRRVGGFDAELPKRAVRTRLTEHGNVSSGALDRSNPLMVRFPANSSRQSRCILRRLTPHGPLIHCLPRCCLIAWQSSIWGTLGKPPADNPQPTCHLFWWSKIQLRSPVRRSRRKILKKQKHGCIQIEAACEMSPTKGLPCWCARSRFLELRDFRDETFHLHVDHRRIRHGLTLVRSCR